MAVHAIRQSVIMSEENRRAYLRAAGQDDSVMRVMEFVKTGVWPSFHKLHLEDQELAKVKHELHVEEGMLFRDHKLVIPVKLRETIAKWIHSSHLGIEKTVSKGKSLYFWPGMNSDLEKEVKQCTTCEKFQRHQQKETLRLEEVPLYPFNRIGVDIFEWGGKEYLSIIDAYSGFMIVEKAPKKSAEFIKNLLHQTFLNFGFPSVIRADNNPFGAKAIVDYCKSNNIQIKFSSPRFPQSNGLAEKGVAISKNIMKRVKEWEEFKMQLLEYNTTVVRMKGFSPTDLFFGRMLRTRKPCHEELLKRKCIPEKMISDRFKIIYDNHCKYFNRGAKDLQDLAVGDVVVFWKERSEWVRGTVRRKRSSRSYEVRAECGTIYLRNRRLIKLLKNEGLPVFGQVEIERDRTVPDAETEEVRSMVDDNENEESDESMYEDAIEEGRGEVAVPDPEVVPRRSGRVVNRPAYLADYV